MASMRVALSRVVALPAACAVLGETTRTEFDSDVLGHTALRHGFPQTSHVVASERFVASFDFRTRNPQWVVEHLTARKIRDEEATRDGESFREAKEIPARMRSRLSDYSGSGFDRGHMAAAANHKNSAASMSDSFSMINISPQVGVGFNRDYWARFEKFCRDLTKRTDDVFVITGPLFLPSKVASPLRADHVTIGTAPSLVHVPTHFFKIVLAENPPRGSQSGAGYALAAFVIPNAPIAPETPLTDFLCPLESVEAASGVLTFGTLLTKERRERLRVAEQPWLDKRPHTKAPRMLGNGELAGKKHKPPQESDLVHLCDRHQCDLVTAAWLKSFKAVE